MKTVYFEVKGRFGNNLFQYFAAEIIKKNYEYDEIKIYTKNNENLIIINDEYFKQITNEYIKGNLFKIDNSKNILLDGYFQRSEYFFNFRDFILNLFNDKNNSYINDKFKICDIVNHKISHNILPKENDLVVHIRLDDFIGDLQIFEPEEIINIIKNIKYEKLYIVCDKLRYFWEYNYMSNFNSLNPIFISYSMLDDFHFIMRAKKILTSASTFAWLAAYFSSADEIHIPYNTFHGGAEGNGQNLDSFNDKCIVYKNLRYWSKN